MGKWVEDLDFIIDFLENHHPDLFGNCNKEVFFRNVDQLKEKINYLDDLQIKIEIMKLIASLNNEHTGLDIGDMIDGPVFPFETMLFNNQLYITGIHKQYAHFQGSEIVKINNNTIEQIISKVSKIIPHNRKELLLDQIPRCLSFSTILYGLSIINAANSKLSIYIKNDHTIKVIDLESNDPNKINFEDYIFPANQTLLTTKDENQNRFYWYEIIKDSQCIYINYNQCRDMEDQSFEEFTDEVFKVIDHNKIKKIIIDLRKNRGGNSSVFQPMVHKLINHPLNRKGSLFSLISEVTFSSGVMNAADLKYKTNATLIGTTTGGLMNGPGDTVLVKSPNFNLHLMCPTKMINAKENYKNIPIDAPNYVRPNIEIKDHISNYIKGIDTQLEYILENIK